MNRSDCGSADSDAGLSDRPPRHRRTGSHRRPGSRRGLITGCALAVSMVLLPASAHADVTERELRTKIDKLTTKAEIVTEKYNGQRLQLEKAKQDARQARRRARRLSSRLEEANDTLANIAAVRYKSGGIGRSISLIAAKDPQEILARATMLTHLSRQKAARLEELQAAVQRAKAARKKAERAAQKVKRITSDLREKKERIEELIAQAEAKLAELEAQEQASRDYTRTPVDVGEVGSGLAARATEIALAQQGDPYQWGAAGPDAFDCSGLVVYAYGQVGISVPHYTGAIWDSYPHISRSQLRPGDIVFTSAHHLGIYVGNGQMVHSPNSGEVVKVEDIYSYYGAVRIV